MAILLWRGDCQGRAQVTEVTFDNVEAHDRFTLTINRKDITVEADEDDALTIAGTATEITLIDDVINAFVTAIGQFSNSIPEWAEVSASAVENTGGYAIKLVLTGKDDGTPFTVTGSDADAAGFSVRVTTIAEATAGLNEKQVITLGGNPTGGTFTLTFDGQTTGNLDYDATAAEVETALEGLSNIAAGDVAVSGDDGGPWTIEFLQAYAQTDVPLITGSGANLTGACSVSVTTTTQGSGTTNEIQTVSYTYPALGGGAWKIRFNNTRTGQDSTTGDLDPSISATYLQTVLEALPSIGSGNVSVSGSGSSYAEGETVTFTIEFIGSEAGYNHETIYDSGSLGTHLELDIETTQTGSTSGVDEVQVVTLAGGPTGGTFTLTFSGQTTAGIAYNAAAADVKSALEALSNVTTVTVTGTGPWTVTFNDPGDQDVAQMTGSGASLTGASVSASVSQAATAPANEKQLVELIGNVQGGTFTLTFDPGTGNETTGTIAYNASAATVETALEGLTSIASGDVNVTGSAGGPWTVEFLQAYAGTDVLPMTGDGSGLTGADTQTVSVSTTTNPTGPNWFSEAENWQTVGSSTAAAPANGDTLVFADSEVSCTFGLDGLPTITPALVVVKASYTGNIGLATYNALGYYEYRATALKTKSAAYQIGEGDGSGSGLLRFDCNSTQVTANVYQTGSAPANAAACIFKGTAAGSVMNVYRGSVGIATENHEDTAVVEDLFVGFVDSEESDATVYVGPGVTDMDDVIQTGGTVIFESDSTLTLESYIKRGGTLVFGGAGGMTLFRNLEGRADWNSSGTAATVEVGSGGELYALRPLGGTFTNCELQAGATLVAPGTLTLTNGVNLDNCGIDEVTLDLGVDIKLTPAAL